MEKIVKLENKMQDSKREELWQRLAPVVLEREEGFGNITVGGATDQQGKDNLLDFISSEILKAREEVIKNLIKKIEEANCDSISLEFLREIDLSKLTTK